MNIKKWVVAARLRTLPLSSSAVIVGITVGLSQSSNTAFSYRLLFLVFFILLTSITLQIISNFANDYGDALSGVDNDKRVGPKRSLFMGLMTKKEMKFGIALVIFLAIVFGCTAIALAFYENPKAFLLFLWLGFLSIVAAVTYTIGLVYGYKGFGDLAVFIFFGLVAVLGAQYMISLNIDIYGCLLGMVAGLMAILVLNVNNLRDYESDRVSGKNSLVVKFGLRGGKIYHAVVLSLVIMGNIAMIILMKKNIAILPLILSIPLIISSIYCIHPKHVNGCLDPYLKKTSISASLINLSWSLIFLLNYF
jgi:1,4-dihydroxy-2-naphthoate polyprenyltransferase